MRRFRGIRRVQRSFQSARGEGGDGNNVGCARSCVTDEREHKDRRARFNNNVQVGWIERDHVVCYASSTTNMNKGDVLAVHTAGYSQVLNQ